MAEPENSSSDVEQQSSSLEQSATQTSVEDFDNSDALNVSAAPAPATVTNPDAIKVKPKLSDRIAAASHGINIYFIAFIVILVIAIIVVFVARSSNNDLLNPTLSDQDLSDEVLNELLQNESSVGEVNQTLTVEANAIFNGKILVKDSLDVAGSINVGGPLSLPGITVSGNSSFDEVDVSGNLSVAGDTSILGNFSVQSGFSVNGDASVSGSFSANRIATETLEFSGDLQMQRHVDTGGPSPSASPGGTVGIGGTVSVSGTDASGTVTINTGSGPGPGTLANISFAAAYNGTPRVIISPVGQTSSTINYYVTRTTTGFTISSSSTPTSSTSYNFDYWVSE